MDNLKLAELSASLELFACLLKREDADAVIELSGEAANALAVHLERASAFIKAFRIQRHVTQGDEVTA